jgi:hypothetical protein
MGAFLLSVGLDARYFGKSFETSLKGFFFRSAVVPDKLISRRVNLFIVAYQFPRPSVRSLHVIFVPTAKMKTANVAVVAKLLSSDAVVIDSSLFFVCHWSPLPQV